MIYASFFIIYTVSSPWLGLVGDRFNTRLLLTLFVAVLGVGTFLMAFSSSIIQASLFFILAGIGSAVIMVGFPQIATFLPGFTKY